MKKSYWIVGGIGLSLLFLGVIVNFLLTFGASRSATHFLAELGEGRTPQAYIMTTRAYQEKTSAKEFSRLARRWNLRNFSKTEGWEDQSGTGQVTITTNVKTASGNSIPLMMKLIKEEGSWRVDELRGPPPPAPRYIVTKGFGRFRFRPSSEGTETPNRPPVPSPDETRALLKGSLLDLDRALETGDYKTFRNSVAQAWQDESPPTVFERVLNDLDHQTLDLTTTIQIEPIFTPVVDRDGRLGVRGKYVSTERALDFHFNYGYEPAGWKLLSFWIGLRDLLPEEIADEEPNSGS